MLVVFLGVGLTLDPREIPSPFINKKAPEFSVPSLYDPKLQVSNTQFIGKVWLFNVFASWCVACRQEHPLLNQMAKQNLLTIVGMNYKDERKDAINWLSELGNPYSVIAHDYEGEVGINYGVYGVPESFLIDKSGLIRYKQIGPFTAEIIKSKLIPMINELQSEL